MNSVHNDANPLLTAVSGSVRHLFQLLKCIAFATKAQVRITPEGIRFTVEESRVVQGVAFLEKSLFTSYNYAPPTSSQTDDDEIDDTAVFQISLAALLETLQIFGVNEIKDRWASRDPAYGGMMGALGRGGRPAAFGNRVLGMPGVCRLSYAAKGEPLCVVLEEEGVTTSCEMVTYEPEDQEEIPFQRDALTLKIIMRSNWLHDAVNELSSTSPSRLTMAASPSAPYLVLSSNGPLGSAAVEFSKDQQLLETFQVPKRTVNTYKYSLIKAATRAMSLASKVCIRGDEQGVLSLQFMIEVEGVGVHFMDFRFVPFLPEEGEDDLESNDEMP
ncbi:checkpoint clamp complex protein Rad1 [Xanthoria calcicola]